MTIRFLATFCFLLLASLPVLAQETPTGPMPDAGAISNSLFQDFNGDGEIRIAAFGDSLTRGIGDRFAVGEDVERAPDFIAGEAGYPLRLETYIGIEIANRGVGGERLVSQGVARFARTMPGLRPDVVIIGEGTNDGGDQVSEVKVRRAMQSLVNIAFAIGSEPILLTTLPACCNHDGHELFTKTYDRDFKEIADVNDIRIVDVDRAFRNSCGGRSRCFLLNLPEGLHPNIDGYDVMAEAIAATMFGIDVFAADGPKNLNDALGLPEDTVKIQSDPVIQ